MTEKRKEKSDRIKRVINSIKEKSLPLVEKIAKRFGERHPDAKRKFAKAAVTVATIATIGAGCAPKQNVNKDDKVKSNTELVAEQIDAYIDNGEHMTYDAAKEMLANGIKEGHLQADTATYSTWDDDCNDVLIANTVCYGVNKDNPGKFDPTMTAIEHFYVDENGKENGESSLTIIKNMKENDFVKFSYPNTPATVSYNGNFVEDRYYQSASNELNSDYQEWYGNHTNCRVVLSNEYGITALQDYDKNNKPSKLILKTGKDEFKVVMGREEARDGKVVFYGKGESASHIDDDALTPASTRTHGKIFGSTR